MSDFYETYGRLLIQIGVISLATVIIAVLVKKLGDRILKRLAQNTGTDLTNIRFLQHTLTALIIMVGLGLVIYIIPGLRHVANTLITTAGILAIVIGFASQAALSNIISGIFIVIFKPYRIKDRITIKDTLTGIVEDVSLRHTVIRNFENKRIIVPNSVISNEIIVNSDYTDSAICRWLDISISYDSDISLAKKILQEEALKHPNILDRRTPEDIRNGVPQVVVRVVALGGYSIDLRAWVWAEDPPKAFEMHCDLLESVKMRFDREGVEIPYPYQNLLIKKESQSKFT